MPMMRISSYLLICFALPVGVQVRDAEAAQPYAQQALDAALSEFDQAQALQADAPDKARRLYRSAAQRFESILASGIQNGALHYNLANCYLQAGQIGDAILHYRRAERLAPRDPLLKDNLREARSRCLTAIPSGRKTQFLKSVFFWHYDSSVTERAWASVIAYVLFWVFLALRNVVPRRGVTIVALAMLLTCAAGAGSVALDAWNNKHTPHGVVVGMDVVVRKGPGESYQRQFEQPLQPGVEFQRKVVRAEWWHVILPDGQMGWIESQAARLVRPTGTSHRLGAF